MRPIAIYFVFDHLERLREEARSERSARGVDPRPSVLRRVTSAFRAALSQVRPVPQPTA